ncbi:hypothetical protein ACLOJK_009624 [Asimina triloba]
MGGSRKPHAIHNTVYKMDGPDSHYSFCQAQTTVGTSPLSSATVCTIAFLSPQTALAERFGRLALARGRDKATAHPWAA